MCGSQSGATSEDWYDYTCYCSALTTSLAEQLGTHLIIVVNYIALVM